MLVTPHFVILQFVAQLRTAFTHKRLTFQFSSRVQSSNLSLLLITLRTLGVISHFERLPRSQQSQPTRSTFIIHLRYCNGRPTVCVWAYAGKFMSTHRIDLQTLHLFTLTSAGVCLLLRTSHGFLTAEQCLSRRCAGSLCLAFTVG